MIKIVIPGKPISKARPRFFKRGKFTGTYNSQETEEGRAMWHVAQAAGNMTPIAGPCRAMIDFYFERPKSHFGTGKNAGRLKPSAPVYPIQKKRNDIDNLEKFTLDVCNGIIFVDDSQVVEVRKRKAFCAPGATAATVLIIDEL